MLTNYNVYKENEFLMNFQSNTLFFQTDKMILNGYLYEIKFKVFDPTKNTWNLYLE
jgi:hypothetical protein